MRISEIESLLQGLDFTASMPRVVHPTSGNPKVPGTPFLDNLVVFREAMRQLARIPQLSAMVGPIVQSQVFESSTKAFTPEDGAASFHARVLHLFDTLSSLRAVLKNVVPAANESSVMVKLPPGEDFGAVIADQKEFLDAIEQVILHPSIQGRMELRGWENGSLWLHLYLGAPLAVTVVGSIVWAATVIRNKKLQGDLIIKQLEAWEVKNDFNAHVAEKAKEALDTAINAEALAIYERHSNGEDDHEQVQRIKRSIKMLSDLIHRGAEVHPSLMAPEDAKNLFPDFKALDTIGSKILQLSEGAQLPKDGPA